MASTKAEADSRRQDAYEMQGSLCPRNASMGIWEYSTLPSGHPSTSSSDAAFANNGPSRAPREEFGCPNARSNGSSDPAGGVGHEALLATAHIQDTLLLLGAAKQGSSSDPPVQQMASPLMLHVQPPVTELVQGGGLDLLSSPWSTSASFCMELVVPQPSSSSSSSSSHAMPSSHIKAAGSAPPGVRHAHRVLDSATEVPDHLAASMGKGDVKLLDSSHLGAQSAGNRLTSPSLYGAQLLHCRVVVMQGDQVLNSTHYHAPKPHTLNGQLFGYSLPVRVEGVQLGVAMCHAVCSLGYPIATQGQEHGNTPAQAQAAHSSSTSTCVVSAPVAVFPPAAALELTALHSLMITEASHDLRAAPSHGSSSGTRGSRSGRGVRMRAGSVAGHLDAAGGIPDPATQPPAFDSSRSEDGENVRVEMAVLAHHWGPLLQDFATLLGQQPHTVLPWPPCALGMSMPTPMCSLSREDTFSSALHTAQARWLWEEEDSSLVGSHAPGSSTGRPGMTHGSGLQVPSVAGALPVPPAAPRRRAKRAAHGMTGAMHGTPWSMLFTSSATSPGAFLSVASMLGSFLHSHSMLATLGQTMLAACARLLGMHACAASSSNSNSSSSAAPTDLSHPCPLWAVFVDLAQLHGLLVPSCMDFPAGAEVLAVAATQEPLTGISAALMAAWVHALAHAVGACVPLPYAECGAAHAEALAQAQALQAPMQALSAPSPLVLQRQQQAAVDKLARRPSLPAPHALSLTPHTPVPRHRHRHTEAYSATLPGACSMPASGTLPAVMVKPDGPLTPLLAPAAVAAHSECEVPAFCASTSCGSSDMQLFAGASDTATKPVSASAAPSAVPADCCKEPVYTCVGLRQVSTKRVLHLLAALMVLLAAAVSSPVLVCSLLCGAAALLAGAMLCTSQQCKGNAGKASATAKCSTQC